MKYFIAFAVVAMVGVQAEAKKLYGTAGCGLGNLIFGKNMQVLAATTNGSFYSQSFGISSGTSNCQDNGGGSAQNRMPRFVESNQVALANDIARGQGETVASLSKIMGCSNVDLVGTTLQKNYERIFTTNSTSASDITNTILGVVKSESELAADCKAVI